MLFINHLTACVHWRFHEGHNESIIFQPQLPVCASVSVNRERLQIGGSEEATEDEDTWLLASSMSPLFVVWVEVAVPAAVFEEVQAERGSICVFKHSHNNRCRREQSLLGFEWRRLCTQRMNVPLTTPRKQNAYWCPWLLHQLNERRELSRRVQQVCLRVPVRPPQIRVTEVAAETSRPPYVISRRRWRDRTFLIFSWGDFSRVTVTTLVLSQRHLSFIWRT